MYNYSQLQKVNNQHNSMFSNKSTVLENSSHPKSVEAKITLDFFCNPFYYVSESSLPKVEEI